MKTMARVVVGLVIVIVTVMGLAIAFGGPGQPQSVPNSNWEPFTKVDYSDLPPSVITPRATVRSLRTASTFPLVRKW